MSGLTAFHSEEQGVSQTPLALVELDGLEDGFIGQKIKQSVKKQARKAKHQAALFSLQDLECLGIEEPHSRLEADATAHSLLGEVQKVLQVSLQLIPGTPNLRSFSLVPPRNFSLYCTIPTSHLPHARCSSWKYGRRARLGLKVA
jgi:hypothetical protein